MILSEFILLLAANSSRWQFLQHIAIWVVLMYCVFLSIYNRPDDGTKTALIMNCRRPHFDNLSLSIWASIAAVFLILRDKHSPVSHSLPCYLTQQENSVACFCAPTKLRDWYGPFEISFRYINMAPFSGSFDW